MNAFSELRAKARERRDKIIAQARKDYESALVQIANLEQDLNGRESSKHVVTSEAVSRAIPSDRTFTTVDIMASLEAMDPGQIWRKRAVDSAVDSAVTRFRARGTRLTNAHSKSARHHAAMVALFAAWYNFRRSHETLGKAAPAMACGLADRKWSIRELLIAASKS